MLLCCVAVLYRVCQYTRSSCVIICRCLLPSHLSFSFSLSLPLPLPSSPSLPPSPRPARRFSHKVRAAGGVKVIVSIMDLYEDDAGVLAVGSDALSGLCSKVRYIPLLHGLKEFKMKELKCLRVYPLEKIRFSHTDTVLCVHSLSLFSTVLYCSLSFSPFLSLPLPPSPSQGHA